MDFFEQQDSARRKTGLLVLYFVFAITLIVVAVNTGCYLALNISGYYSYTPETWLSGPIWLYVTGTTVAVIVYGSLSRFISLSSGGQSVANMVGARRLDLSSADPSEKKYINVTEEMSIASGIPMPQLYVMDQEHAINAFVAGYKPTDTVLVVTKGTLENLDRDELQGVIGHEFSHILNGDMAINLRLIAILAGILSIGQLGQFLLRTGIYVGTPDDRSRNNSLGVVTVVVAFFAVLLIAIGYLGLFFGRLIKAAISRQREFLADSSAVQFTRNPRGISGALYKIGQNDGEAFLESRHAEDMSHMCFGETVHMNFRGLLATHPSVDERIRAIDPAFLNIQRAKRNVEKRAQREFSEHTMGFSGAGPVHSSSKEIVHSVGNVTPEHLNYAASIHKTFSDKLMGFVHSKEGAMAIIYAFLLTDKDSSEELTALKSSAEMDLVSSLGDELEVIKKLDPRQRLPLIELILPSLKQLSSSESKAFLTAVKSIVYADQKITFFEFVMLTILEQNLQDKLGRADKIKYRSFKAVIGDIHLILSVLIHQSKQSSERKESSFNRCIASFTQSPLTILSMNEVSFRKISQSLGRLNLLSFLLKKCVLEAFADSVLDDGIIMPGEAELLRAISESMGCPMPPLLPDAFKSL